MRLRLFGSPEVRLGGQIVPLPLGKPLALLCYLAASAPRAVPRRELCALLWDDPAPQHLRQALYTLRRACAGQLAAEGQGQLRYTGESDLDGLEALPDGLFLDGLETVAAPGFLAWLAHQRRAWASRGIVQAGLGLPMQAQGVQSQLLQAQTTQTQITQIQTTQVHDLPDDWLSWAQSVWGSPDPEAISRLLFGDGGRALEVAERLGSLRLGILGLGGLTPEAAPPIPEPVKRLLHTRAAEVLQRSGAERDNTDRASADYAGAGHTNADPEKIAHHYLAAQRPEQAGPFLLASARRLLNERHPERAQRQALLALWTSPDLAQGGLTQRIEALFVLEQLAQHNRQTALHLQWLAELERLVFQSQSDDLLCRLALVQAQRRQRAGKLDLAAQAARSALEIARRLGKLARQHEASLLLGALALGSGQLAEAASALRPLLAASDLGVQMRARLNLGTVYAVQGRRGVAVQHFERALTLARQLGQLGAVSAALNNLAGSYEGLARYADAAQMARGAYQLATQQENLPVRITALLNMAEFHRSAGAYGPCWNTVQEALELVGPDTGAGLQELHGLHELRSALLARQGMLERRFGRLKVAQALLKRALVLARQVEGPRAALIAEMQLALIELPGEQATSDLAQTAARFRAHGYGLLADLTELHAVHHDPQATPAQLLAVWQQHRRHPHPHLAWLAAFQGFRENGASRGAVLRGLERFQFAEAPEVLALLGERERAAALRLEQASGLPGPQRRAFLRLPLS